VPGHTSLPEWHDQAAAWLLSVLTPAAAQQEKAPPKTQSAESKAPDEPNAAWLTAVKGFPRMRIEQRTVKPLFTCQEKWEGAFISYISVVRDKNAWHMWYESFDGAPRNDVQRLLCYARSRDGVRWERPNLGLVEYGGNKNNNILMDGLKSPGVAGSTVFLDERAPAAERFKMVFIRPGGGGAAGAYPIFGATSPDGVNWRVLAEPLLKGSFDTQNVCFRDGDVFRLYVRLWTRGRTVGYCQSPAFGNFPKPKVILSADDRDPAGMDFYDSAATKLAGNLYVMFPSAFYTKEKDGPVRPHMAVSRNGKDFQRVGRNPVLPMGRGSFDSTTIYVATAVPGDRPGTYWFYYVGYKTGHHVNYEPKGGGIGRFCLLVDEESK